jgi:hypothetical protein
MFLFIPALILLVLSSCTTRKGTDFDEFDYLVTTEKGVFRCDRLDEGPYGIVALDCHQKKSIYSAIINPRNVVVIKQVRH